jgi:hypothetical protein
MNHCTVLDPYPRIVKIQFDNTILEAHSSFGVKPGMHLLSQITKA